MNLMVTQNNNSLTFLAPNSQIRAVRFFMTKQMQTFSLSKRQLSQHPQWIQFWLEMTQIYLSSCYIIFLNMAKIFFFASDRKKNTKGRVWNIKEVRTKLGTFVCKHIPFLHAFLGCDTTSCLFGIGKGSIIKKFRDNKSLQQVAIIFDNTNATQAQIDHAG